MYYRAVFALNGCKLLPVVPLAQFHFNTAISKLFETCQLCVVDLFVGAPCVRVVCPHATDREKLSRAFDELSADLACISP